MSKIRWNYVIREQAVHTLSWWPYRKQQKIKETMNEQRRLICGSESPHVSLCFSSDSVILLHFSLSSRDQQIEEPARGNINVNFSELTKRIRKEKWKGQVNCVRPVYIYLLSFSLSLDNIFVDLYLWHYFLLVFIFSLHRDSYRNRS